MKHESITYFAKYYQIPRNQLYLALEYLDKKRVKNKDIRRKVVENIRTGRSRCYLLDGKAHLQLIV